MTNYSTLQLGLEEVVVAISLIGQPQVAKSLLWSNVGEIKADEERGRLLAAHHSLLAKQLITLQSGEARPTEELVQVAQLLVQHQFVIRFSRGSGSSERVLAYYFNEGRILSHFIESGVAHQLSFIADRAQIAEAGARFLELTTASEIYPEATLSEAILNKAKELARSAPDQIEQILADADIAEPTRRSLVEDLRQTVYRGSVMRVEVNAGELQSNRGALLLKGPARLWLMQVRPQAGGSTIVIRFATPDTLRSQIDALID